MLKSGDLHSFTQRETDLLKDPYKGVKTLIRCLVAERNLPKSYWPAILQEVAFAHIATRTKYSPSEVMYGNQPWLPSPICTPVVLSDSCDAGEPVKETRKRMKELWNDVRQNTTSSQDTYKLRYDAGKRDTPLGAGMFVYI